MLNLKYARLLWRYAWRRLLTPAGWRWETEGPVFFGRGLELQIGRGATVRFGRFSWIGDGACFLRGVRVGDNSVIGTYSVVNRDVPANTVVGGIPARVLRIREVPKRLRWREPVEPPAPEPE